MNKFKIFLLILLMIIAYILGCWFPVSNMKWDNKWNDRLTDINPGHFSAELL